MNEVKSQGAQVEQSPKHRPVLKVEKLSFQHLTELMAMEPAGPIQSSFNEEQLKNLSQNPYSFSLTLDGKVALCGGVIDYWPGRGTAWIMDPAKLKGFPTIRQILKSLIDECPTRRIEGQVGLLAGQELERQWFESLGFELETPRAKAFWPNGGDVSIYVKINDASQPAIFSEAK